MSVDNDVVNATSTATNAATSADEVKYFCNICDAVVKNVEETDEGSFRCLICGGMFGTAHIQHSTTRV